MEAAKTETQKPELRLVATTLCASGGSSVGEIVAVLCNLFMHFTGDEARAVSAACMLGGLVIGLVVGLLLDNKYDVKH